MLAKNKLVPAALLASAVAAASLCSAQSLAERAKADELVFMGDKEPAMQRAFSQARASLDDFLRKAKNPAAGTTSYGLKVGVREGTSVEYFWLVDFIQSQDGFVGTISNEPRMVKTVRYGQRYTFAREHIVDWVYVDRNQRRMMGNFTACALLTKEPASEAEAVKKQYGLQCD